MTVHGTTRTALRGILALVALVLVGAGLPTALVRAVGWPLPRSLPTWAQLGRALGDSYIPDQVLINALAIVCWIVWALLMACVTVEAVAAGRGLPPPRVPFAGPIQSFAGQLVAAVTLAAVLATPRAATAAPPPLPAAEQVATPVSDSIGVTAAQPLVVDIAPQTLPRYVVQPRDDLWSIAERHLADPYRWTEVWDLNQRRRQPDGRTFTDPDLIHPGWILDLPADALGIPPTGESQPPAPDGSSPSGGEAGVARPPLDAATTRPVAPSAEDPPAATNAPPERPTAPDMRPRAPDDRPPPRAADDRDDIRSPGPVVELPSGALVGLSLAAVVSGALATARLHRRRRYQPADPHPGVIDTEPLATEAVRHLRRADLAEASAQGNDAPSSPAVEPGTVTIGHRDGQPILLHFTTIGGLCLSGPTTVPAARAIMIDFLGPDASGQTAVLIADADVAQELLGDIPPLPDLQVLEGADGALTRLEVELVRRTRLLDDADAADFHTYRRQHPEEPMPALLLVTNPPATRGRARLDAVLNLGRRLGIGALILGSPSGLPAITIDEAANVTAVRHADHLPELINARICTLNAIEFADLLAVLAARSGNADSGNPDSAAEPDGQSFPAHPSPAETPIAIRLFGPMRIEAAGEEVRSGLRSKARELLAFLLLRPAGATADAAIDALWPDADPTRGGERFRTTLSNLRTVLRQAARLPDATIIERAGPRYQIDHHRVCCDLWEFQSALTDAAEATDHQATTAALQEAARNYQGDLLDGAYYEWAEPAREDLRRRALDTLARLADLHDEAGDPDTALATLEQAIAHDPYAEILYQRIMRLQAHLSRPDALRRTYRLLETRLSDLGAEPDPVTERLRGQLLRLSAGRTSAP